MPRGRPDLKVDDLLEQIFSRLPERDLGTLIILGDFNRKDVAQERFEGADWPVASHLEEMNRKLRMTGRHFDFPYRRWSDYSPNDHIFIWTEGEVRNLHARLRATWPSWQEVMCSDHFPLAVSLEG
jgi:endonuclease/exonuclease/phosphatase family metal-dependent hydrolase